MPTRDESIAIMADTFKILGDNTRLKIMLACCKDEMSVSDIAENIGASPSLVSHHLRLMKAYRLIAGRSEGKRVFYGADDDHIKGIISDMLNHVEEE
ncbi:metalloregulator ArsR/SmtB family transcription factor [Deferribacterales bacterium RsTz2092]|nr:hypothetical protein AGMMS49941_06000 [Deferribacterales bacterium]